MDHVVTSAEPHNPQRGVAAGVDASAAAPGGTAIGTAVIILGVLVQASVAGGFLAGSAILRALHAYFGYGLLSLAAVVLVAGLVARRSNREPLTILATRVGLFSASAATVFAGMRATRASPVLLMVHIPLSFVITALAARLLILSRRSRARSTPTAS